MRNLGVVATVTAILLVGVTWFMPESSSRHNAAQFQHDPTKDPRLGLEFESLAISSVDATGREISGQMVDVLVVQGGSCTGCSLNAVQYSKLPTGMFDRIYVVYQSVAAEIVDSAKGSEIPGNVFLVTDEHDVVKDKLYANWIGRWYAFKNGQLVRIQRDLDDDPWMEVTR